MAPHEAGGGFGEAPVFASEGENLEVGFVAEDAHHAVDVQPGAVDDDAGRDVARGAGEHGVVPGAAGFPHLEAGADSVAVAGKIRREGSRHVTEVDRSGGRDVERLDAARVRFDLRDSAGADALHGHAVRRSAPFEFGDRGELISRGGDHDLAGARGRNAPLRAVAKQSLGPFGAQPRLERPGRVVQSGMDDAAVAARLVCRDLRLLLEHREREVRPGPPDRVGRREPDDAAPDDGDVERLRHPPPESASCPTTHSGVSPRTQAASICHSGSSVESQRRGPPWK